jgi:hypothetical protein
MVVVAGKAGSRLVQPTQAGRACDLRLCSVAVPVDAVVFEPIRRWDRHKMMRV